MFLVFIAIEPSLARHGCPALRSRPPWWCGRGIIPIYSLYYPVGGKYLSYCDSRLRNFFEQLASRYKEIRHQHGLEIWDGFMCHRCAYMQLECDIDRQLRNGE